MEEVNLLAMGAMSKAFGLPTGYSDHTHGLLVPSAAVAMGATIIEKHFTLDRNLPGPDHLASLEPDELKQMIEDIRQIEILLGDGRKLTQASEWDTRAAARQRIVAAKKIAQGEQFGPSNLGTARTGKGELPVTIWDRFGQKSADNFEIGGSI
jgi:N-acetylneuraminate synthase